MSKGDQFTSWGKRGGGGSFVSTECILRFPDELTASTQGDTRLQPLVYFVSCSLAFYAPVEERG
jgi:hypothetical protein